MHLIKHITVLIFILQYIVNGFNIFDISNGFNYLSKQINSIVPPLLQEIYIKTRWISQKLDHFDPQDLRTFDMRYFENLKYWKENGPIFLFLGGEGTSTPQWTKSGIMYELAKETRGAMYVTEHRYYGKSKPISTSAHKFKYLNSKQALADIAKLINSLKILPKFKNSKVVVIGGSYAGNLATWMKVLYPDLVDAAIASSAPVLAKTDFYEYLEKVNDNYENYGTEGCLDRIKEKFDRYNSLLQSPEGITQLKKDKNICESCDMEILENQQLFFEVMVQPFMIISQYKTIEDIKVNCESLIDINFDDKFSMEQSFARNVYSEKRKCYNYDFNEMIRGYKENDHSYLAWLYQTCNEFGYYQTTTSKAQVFLNIPLQYFIKICTGVFGADFDEKRIDEKVERTNKLYGGLKPNVTQVVFTNGGLDPWSTISVLEDLSYDAPAVVIPRTSHCGDLFSNVEHDIEELKEARKHIKYLIEKWIGLGEYMNS